MLGSVVHVSNNNSFEWYRLTVGVYLLQTNGRATSEVRAPIAAAESVIESPVKMQASPAAAAPAPTPTASPATSQSFKPTKRTAKDYIFGKLIGDGMFSTVFLAKDIHSGKEYASE